MLFGRRNMITNIGILLIILLIILLTTLNERTTSIGNYFELGFYLFAIFSTKSFTFEIKSIYVYAVLVFNIAVLLIYPDVSKHLNVIEHFEYFNYPIWTKYLVLNTLGYFALTVIILKKNEIGLTILLVFLLIVGSKTTNLILLLITLFYGNTSSFKGLLIVLIIFLFMYASYNFFPVYLKTRLGVLSQMDFKSDEFARIPLLINSFNTFTANFFFGVGYYKKEFSDVLELLTMPIGHHSHLVDNLARFGILWLFVVIKEGKNVNLSLGNSGLLIYLPWIALNNIISISLVTTFIFVFYGKNIESGFCVK